MLAINQNIGFFDNIISLRKLYTNVAITDTLLYWKNLYDLHVNWLIMLSTQYPISFAWIAAIYNCI